MNKNINILIVGVGGQGVLLASEVLSEAAMLTGFDVKKSEVHGMSQRGGVVSSHVKIAPRVFSPIISYGQADILVSFEQYEALRAIDWVKKDGLIASSLTRLIPPIVTSGKFDFPKDPSVELKNRFGQVILIDADKIALEMGNARLVNIILLGAIASRIGFEFSIWEKAIRARVKASFVDLNIQAFNRGKELAANTLNV